MRDDNKLVVLSKQLAVDIVKLCNKIKDKSSAVLVNQLLKSGTSIGANIHEANYASSRADFINKFQIALKECYESEYWLELFRDTEMITAEEYSDIYNKCCRIRRLLIVSVNTARENEKQ